VSLLTGASGKVRAIFDRNISSPDIANVSGPHIAPRGGWRKVSGTKPAATLTSCDAEHLTAIQTSGMGQPPASC